MAFVLCAVLPMLGTVGAVAYSLRPWREGDWQRMLSQELHIRAAVEQVASPKPGVMRLLGVQLADLRSSRRLGSVDRLEARWRGSQLTLAIDEMEIDANQLTEFATAVTTWLASDDAPLVELRIDRLKLSGRDQQSLALADTRLHCDMGEGHSNRIGMEAGSVRLLIERGDSITATLHTGTDSLPAWLLTCLLPSLSRCGDATFKGSLRLQSDAEELAGALRGRFDHVALDQWLGPDRPHLIQGEATVEFDELQWRGSRLLTATGRMRVENGVVGCSLLTAVQERLYCTVASDVVVAEVMSFDELACGFQLSAAGLNIDGQCQAPKGDIDCLIVAGGRPLLLAPPYANLPVAQLVQVLSQPAASWLPASIEAHEMAGKLPLPSGTSTR